MNRDAYERYLACFNSKDYDGVADFYAEPLKMDFFGVSIRSREDLTRFYTFLHSYVKESVRVLNFAASDTLTAVDGIVRIEAICDLTQDVLDANGASAFHPMEAGQILVHLLHNQGWQNCADRMRADATRAVEHLGQREVTDEIPVGLRVWPNLPVQDVRPIG
jgi:hypothetical protein